MAPFVWDASRNAWRRLTDSEAAQCGGIKAVTPADAANPIEPRTLEPPLVELMESEEELEALRGQRAALERIRQGETDGADEHSQTAVAMRLRCVYLEGELARRDQTIREQRQWNDRTMRKLERVYGKRRERVTEVPSPRAERKGYHLPLLSDQHTAHSGEAWSDTTLAEPRQRRPQQLQQHQRHRQQQQQQQPQQQQQQRDYQDGDRDAEPTHAGSGGDKSTPAPATTAHTNSSNNLNSNSSSSNNNNNNNRNNSNGKTDTLTSSSATHGSSTPPATTSGRNHPDQREELDYAVTPRDRHQRGPAIVTLFDVERRRRPPPLDVASPNGHGASSAGGANNEDEDLDISDEEHSDAGSADPESTRPSTAPAEGAAPAGGDTEDRTASDPETQETTQRDEGGQQQQQQRQREIVVVKSKELPVKPVGKPVEKDPWAYLKNPVRAKAR
jgi:hypothetical protein